MEYVRVSRGACKLDPYKSYLLGRIEQARPDWIPASVLMREIGAMGYAGGLSQLKGEDRAGDSGYQRDHG